jgi:CheY-like chemotaxis protein
MKTPAPPGNRIPPKPPPLDLRGLAILIVEDDTDSREMLEQMVGSFGATVLSARHGADAMDRVAEQAPDLVFCDLVMPRVDGYSFVEWLKRSPRFCRIPVIAISALGTPADFAQTLAAGFSGHLLKPIDYGIIEAQLRRVFPER